MSKFNKGIKKGKKVLQGEVIGYVGSTGLATGPHVCFRFWRNGKQVDPYKQKDLPEGEPISPKHLNSFLYVKDKYISSLSD
jgi:murein DD-endopeptidase MepM/ murein hydrolase activator NlpD